jgi:hypothetical protein
VLFFPVAAALWAALRLRWESKRFPTRLTEARLQSTDSNGVSLVEAKDLARL